MKKIVFFIASQICLTATYAQYISADDITFVNDLYVAEQYGAFADRLKNIGFHLKESVEDYTLNNITYRSEWTFEKESKAEWDPRLSETGNAEKFNTSFWNFQIEDRPLLIKVNIRLFMYSTNAKILYDNLCFKWRDKEQAIETVNSTIFNKTMLSKTENFGIDLENGNVYKLPERFYANISGGESVVEFDLSYCIAKRALNQPIDEYLEGQKNNKANSIISVPISNEGKISKVKISIGGRVITYIIDSGASDMNISQDIENYLREIGALRTTDYLAPAKYQLADGSIKEYRRVTLGSVKIGDITVESVVANITADSEMLLLGKSFFNRFAYWKIDNKSQTLELKRK